MLVPEIISASTFADLMPLEPVYLLITILWEFASFPFAKPFQDFGLVLFFWQINLARVLARPSQMLEHFLDKRFSIWLAMAFPLAISFNFFALSSQSLSLE